MQRRIALGIAWFGFATLLALHIDYWRPQRVIVYGGVLPEEIGYRMLWMAGAWILLLFVCARLFEDRSG